MEEKIGSSSLQASDGHLSALVFPRPGTFLYLLISRCPLSSHGWNCQACV
jgi:hypothetical protein